jgi:hypothetical protein
VFVGSPRRLEGPSPGPRESPLRSLWWRAEKSHGAVRLIAEMDPFQCSLGYQVSGQSLSTKDEPLRRLGMSFDTQRGGRSGERAETPPKMGEKIVEYSPGCRTALRNRDCCSVAVQTEGEGCRLLRSHDATSPLRRPDPVLRSRDIGPLGYRSEIAYFSTAHMSTSRRIWVVPSSKMVLTSNRHPPSSSILTRAELAGAR